MLTAPRKPSIAPREPLAAAMKAVTSSSPMGVVS